jgi:hypothetical protein
MTFNYRKVVTPELNRTGLDGKKVYANAEECSRAIKSKLLKDYFSVS